MPVGSHPLPSELLSTCSDGMLYCFAQWANTVTGGMFWSFMLIGFMVVLMMATTRLGNTRAFGYASTVGLIGGIWFAILNLIPWWIATVFILVGAIGLAMMVLSERT